jgi:hypothetical protein
MNSAKPLSAGTEALFDAAMQFPHFRARVERTRAARRWQAAVAELSLSLAQVAKKIGCTRSRLEGLLWGARDPTDEERDRIERLLKGEVLDDVPRKPEPALTAKPTGRSAQWTARLERSGLSLAEIGRRSGIGERRTSGILRRNAHPRGDEQQRLERVLGRENAVVVDAQGQAPDADPTAVAADGIPFAAPP